MTTLPLAVASDHAGLTLKVEVCLYLESHGVPVHDFGTHTPHSVDYPDYAALVAEALRQGRAERGILICGSGIGITIAANRFKGVRAALCHDVTGTRLARLHNNANVLVLGARTIGLEVAKDCILAFLQTPFEGGRHQLRVDKLDQLG